MSLTLAIPRGRLEVSAKQQLAKAGITVHKPPKGSLVATTNRKDLRIATVRSFDVATFVAFGGADLGIVGSDVLEEFNYSEIYELKDLNIGVCRLSLAGLEDAPPLSNQMHIATKYPALTTAWLREKSIEAHCIKLNGAIEIAPKLGLCQYVTDLVDSGRTLKANHLVERQTILNVSAHLVANRTSWKMKGEQIQELKRDIPRA